jgi:8-oxo-dGTP diphosphatase
MTQDVTGKKMVCGFLFAGERVLLVQKNTPEWQRGLLNGVGGKIEAEETPLEAMHREFCEEAGPPPDTVQWIHFATEVEPFGAYVYFFKAHVSRISFVLKSSNDVGEVMLMVHLDDLAHMAMARVGNLSWLIPLACDWREMDPVVVTTRGDIRERASW